MKKSIKSLISFVVILAVCITILPKNAEAATFVYKYKSAGTATAGQYITTKESAYTSSGSTYTETFYAYKVSFPSNGYIKINRADTNGSLYLLPALSKCSTSEMPYSNALDTTYGQKVAYMVVSKGTYYFCSDFKTKFKYTFTKQSPPTNYCKAKAAALASGKDLSEIGYPITDSKYIWIPYQKVTRGEKQ